MNDYETGRWTSTIFRGLVVAMVVSVAVVVARSNRQQSPAPACLMESVPPLMEAHPRSPKWEKVSRDFIAANPECAACGCGEHLETHHILPYHLHPELELDPSNFIVLCRYHHYHIGHGGRSWLESNPNVRADAAKERRKHRQLTGVMAP